MASFNTCLLNTLYLLAFTVATIYPVLLGFESSHPDQPEQKVAAIYRSGLFAFLPGAELARASGGNAKRLARA